MAFSKEPKRDKIALGIVTIAAYFQDGFVFMLLLGYLHSLDAPIPALGYWACVFIAYIWTFLNRTATGRVDFHVQKVLGYF